MINDAGAKYQFLPATEDGSSVDRQLASAADVAVAGDVVAHQHLGLPVAHLAEAVLGPNDWTPSPSRWSDGSERGRFRRTSGAGQHRPWAVRPKPDSFRLVAIGIDLRLADRGMRNGRLESQQL